MRLAGKVALITGAAAGMEGETMGFGGAAARLFTHEGAIRLFTKAAAIQYAKDNIRVNSIHPGYRLTPLASRVKV